MRRQENIFSIEGNTAQLLCVTDKGVSHAAIFPAEFYSEVRMCKWSYKGKNGISSGFDTSLANFFAIRYGYTESNWRRLEPNEDYFPRNYTFKSVQSSGFIPSNVQNIELFKSSYYPRVKWKSKYECTQLELRVLRYNGVTDTTVTILINKYLQHLVPKYCTIVNSARLGVDVICPDKEPLRHKIFKYVLDTDNLSCLYAAETVARTNTLDYRVDPNDNVFVAYKKHSFRKHSTDEGTIIELREVATDKMYEAWAFDSTNKPQYCIPNIGTKYKNRTAFILVDDAVAEKIVDIKYDARTCEFIVNDILSRKLRPLKYLVADVNGYKYDNIYVPPKMTRRYKALTDKASDMKSIIAASKIENHLSGDGRKTHKMFHAPRYIRRLKLKFNSTFFNTTLYGGVGIHCLDARYEAMYIPTYANVKDQNGSGSILQNETTDRSLSGGLAR